MIVISFQRACRFAQPKKIDNEEWTECKTFRVKRPGFSALFWGKSQDYLSYCGGLATARSCINRANTNGSAKARQHHSHSLSFCSHNNISQWVSNNCYLSAQGGISSDIMLEWIHFLLSSVMSCVHCIVISQVITSANKHVLNMNKERSRVSS